MTAERPPGAVVHPPVHHHPPPLHNPGPVVKRGHVVAVRSAGGSPAPVAAVYAPWGPLIAKADTRLKTEITAAVSALEAANLEAGQILDRSYAMAAESAGALEAAAWAAWNKYMAAADDTRAAIMNPALEAYDAAIARAHDRYTADVADARKTYNSIITDANTAKADAKLASA